MVDLNKYLSLYVEKDEALVLHFTGVELLTGLSGEERPRCRLRGPTNGLEEKQPMEILLRDAVHRGVMVAASERKCILCLVRGERERE